MINDYQISGMTCGGCKEKIKRLLGQVDNVKDVHVSLETGQVHIETDHNIPLTTFKSVLKDFPKYQIEELPSTIGKNLNAEEEKNKKSWIVTYKPLLLIFSYLLFLSLSPTITKSGFDSQRAMRIFMGSFFLTFSFFKLLDLKGFASSYAMYDIVAKKFPVWGFVYVFIELCLGIAYFLNFAPFITNLVTVSVMTISFMGVLQSVLHKRSIRCACLGTVFQLPMSTVTILEDGLMIGMGIMSLFMLI